MGNRFHSAVSFSKGLVNLYKDPLHFFLSGICFLLKLPLTVVGRIIAFPFTLCGYLIFEVPCKLKKRRQRLILKQMKKGKCPKCSSTNVGIAPFWQYRCFHGLEGDQIETFESIYKCHNCKFYASAPLACPCCGHELVQNEKCIQTSGMEIPDVDHMFDGTIIDQWVESASCPHCKWSIALGRFNRKGDSLFWPLANKWQCINHSSSIT